LYYLRISDAPIEVAPLYQKLVDPQFGGIDMFVGTIRQWTGSIETKRIDYTAYHGMAERQLEKIAQPIEAQGGRVVVVHRTGQLALTDIAVFVGVAAPHRAEAFKWCQYVIDTLKQTVPIWKKEYDTDKVRWGN
jgi:molybdopterin synthase catalytic subunit